MQARQGPTLASTQAGLTADVDENLSGVTVRGSLTQFTVRTHHHTAWCGIVRQVFAPTDEAFAEVDEEGGELRSLLLRHVRPPPPTPPVARIR